MNEIGNPFLHSVIDGARDVLAPLRHQTMSGVDREQARLGTVLIEAMIDHGMDGPILVAPMLPAEGLAGSARALREGRSPLTASGSPRRR